MTARESYIQGLIAMFSAASGFPALVERSVSIAFSREESPVLVVHRGAETPDNSKMGVTDRSCEILVSVITRSDTPDKDADDILEVAHPLVLGYMAAGLIDVNEVATEAPRYANTDGQACMITVRYLFLYRTDRDSLAH